MTLTWLRTISISSISDVTCRIEHHFSKLVSNLYIQYSVALYTAQKVTLTHNAYTHPHMLVQLKLEATIRTTKENKAKMCKQSV